MNDYEIALRYDKIEANASKRNVDLVWGRGHALGFSFL